MKTTKIQKGMLWFASHSEGGFLHDLSFDNGIGLPSLGHALSFMNADIKAYLHCQDNPNAYWMIGLISKDNIIRITKITVRQARALEAEGLKLQ